MLIVLHVTAPFALSADQCDVVRDRLDGSVTVNDVLGLSADPVELVFELGGTPVAADVMAGVIAAFHEAGVGDGAVTVALSEHTEDDVEFEAPPYFDQEVDLAGGPGSALATVQIEIQRDQPYTAEEFDALDRQLRSRLDHPVEFVVRVQPALARRHVVRLELVAMSEAELPESADLRARTVAALTAARVTARRLTVGAYLGSWDRTLWQHRWDEPIPPVGR